MRTTIHRLIILSVLLLALPACAFIPALPAPDPGPTATPLVTEGIAGSRALAYNLGTTTIAQSWSADTPEMPVPLLGAISVPEGEGPFPLALVLHGRHPRCYADDAQLEEVWPCAEGAEPRYDIGFSYLLDALAARGYLAVAPSVNGAYTTAYDLGQEALDVVQPRVDERMIQIVEAHVAQLQDAGGGAAIFAGGLDLTGRVDVGRVVVVAHSTSGITANKVAREGTLPVRAQVLLAPMYFANTGATADVPTAVLLSACDGDRSDLPGQTYYERARSSSRAGDLFSAVLAGANHNFYNQELERQGIDDGTFSRNPSCSLARVSGPEQQAFLSALAGDFFDAALGEADAPDWLYITAPAPAELYGQAAQIALSPPVTSRRTLLSGQPELDGPLLAELCPAGEACAEGLLQPGLPDSVRLSWEGEGAEFRVAVPALEESYATVRLRVAVDPTHPRNAAGEPVTFSVVLADAAGNAAAVPLPEPLPFPLESTYEGDGYRFTPVLPVDIRLPLSDFGGVDAATLSSAALRFDGNASGAVLLVDWELAGQP